MRASLYRNICTDSHSRKLAAGAASTPSVSAIFAATCDGHQSPRAQWLRDECEETETALRERSSHDFFEVQHAHVAERVGVDLDLEEELREVVGVAVVTVHWQDARPRRQRGDRWHLNATQRTV